MPSVPLLEARSLSAGYRGAPVVRQIDLRVERGEIVALIGPNGAGKTTTMLTLSGDLPPVDGEVLVEGRCTRAPLHERARQGLALVTDDRALTMGLTTADNLHLGRVPPERAFAIFPELRPLMRRRAGLLSGGEQQMITTARALARDPKLLLIDELSLGLAPLITHRLLRAVRTAATERGVGVLLVEQHVERALSVADRVYVMRRGEIAYEGSPGHLAERLDHLTDIYFARGPGRAISSEP